MLDTNPRTSRRDRFEHAQKLAVRRDYGVREYIVNRIDEQIEQGMPSASILSFPARGASATNAKQNRGRRRGVKSAS